MIQNYQSGSKKKRLCEKRKDEFCNKHVNKNFSYEVTSYNAIMQLSLIDYKELTQSAWGRSQYNNDKMRVVFAERIKCGKDCSLMCSRTQTDNSRK